MPYLINLTELLDPNPTSFNAFANFIWPRGTWTAVDEHIKGTCDIVAGFGGNPQLGMAVGTAGPDPHSRYDLPNVTQNGFAFDFIKDISSHTGPNSGAYAAANACQPEQASIAILPNFGGDINNVTIETYQLILYGTLDPDDPCTPQNDCCLSASPDTVTEDESAFSGTITITEDTAGDCSGDDPIDWSAYVFYPNGAPTDWLHLDGADANGFVFGTDSGTIDYSGDANAAGDSRAAYIVTLSEFCYVLIKVEQDANGGEGDETGVEVDYDVSDAQRHVRAFRRGTTLWTQFLTDVSGDTWQGVATGITGYRPCVRFEKTGKEQRIWLVYDNNAGTVSRVHSENEGGSWSVAETIASGKYATQVIARHKLHYIYWIDGAAIKGAIYDDAGNLVESAFTVVGSGIDDTKISAKEHVRAGGEWHMKLLYTASGTLTSVDSIDGINFA